MARSTARVTDDRFSRLGTGLERFLSVPLERQTYLNLAYLLLAFPLGLAYFVFVVVGVSMGFGFSITIIGAIVGIPILAVTVAIALALAGFERWLTSSMLEVEVDLRTELSGDGRRDQFLSLVTDPKTWTPLVYLPVKFVLGLASFVLAITGLSTGVSMLLLPFYYDNPGVYVGVVPDRAPEIHQTLYLGWNYLLVGFEAVVTVGHWSIDTFPRALAAAAVGIVLLLVTLHVLNGLARLSGWFARVTLEDGYDPFAVVARSL
ncbi:sensor domain-containing protein [Natronobacterium texcoconense]|uniref:Putative sensor n=1 Tax=Natronobacterium texcoconense TaxID=1095778 RepID=A0A1H1FL40_NATTX|nr:sensor domain-containing protein [Natronobacterium texcoconense]SDR01449.1 Putative sensor [Natronobacterium texcoconense]